MNTDKYILGKLKKFGDVFKAACERGENESNTVMILIQFFAEVLGYDPLTGEITKEIPVKDRFCDFAIVLGGKTEEGKPKPEFLVEAKACGVKNLNEKHIEQAYNYASRAPVHWVVLTNGVEWKLYHLAFDEKAGITPDLVFDLKYLEEMEKDPDFLWDKLSVLTKSNVLEKSLETYYEQQKLLSPKTIISTLLGEEVLMKIRQELNRKAPARLAIKDVFHAITKVLDSDAATAAGGFAPPMKKKKKKHRHNNNESEQAEEPISATPSQVLPVVATVAEEIPQ